MTGMKERFGDNYDKWYQRHKVVERQRQWRIKNEANPINALPESDRGPLPETYSLEEAFWHPLACECGSCDGPIPQAVKQYRLSLRPIPPAVKGPGYRLPESSYQLLRRLQAFEEAVLSRADSLQALQTGPEHTPYA